jgi:hypothetical protein
MSGESCGNCRFFESGACRRYPPDVVTGLLPRVVERDWCGEHEPATPAAGLEAPPTPSQVSYAGVNLGVVEVVPVPKKRGRPPVAKVPPSGVLEEKGPCDHDWGSRGPGLRGRCCIHCGLEESWEPLPAPCLKDREHEYEDAGVRTGGKQDPVQWRRCKHCGRVGVDPEAPEVEEEERC